VFITQPSLTDSSTSSRIVFPSDRESNELSMLKQVNICIGEAKAKWKNLLNNRNQMKRKFIRNSDLVKLYDDWLSREAPFLPKAFRPKPTKPVNKEIDAIRLEQGKANMKAEKEVMGLHATNVQKRINEIEEEIKTLIPSLSLDEVIQQKIVEVWKNEVTDGETKVLKEWGPNLEWHKKLPDQPELEENQKATTFPDNSTRVESTDKEKTSPKSILAKTNVPSSKRPQTSRSSSSRPPRLPRLPRQLSSGPHLHAQGGTKTSTENRAASSGGRRARAPLHGQGGAKPSTENRG
jgi:hypothetical protein